MGTLQQGMEEKGICTDEDQAYLLDSINFIEFWKKGVPGIDPFNLPNFEVLPEEEMLALSCYKEEPQFKIFPPRQTAAPDPNSIIFEHNPRGRCSYPPGASIRRRLSVLTDEVPFYEPVNLQ